MRRRVDIKLWYNNPIHKKLSVLLPFIYTRGFPGNFYLASNNTRVLVIPFPILYLLFFLFLFKETIMELQRGDLFICNSHLSSLIVRLDKYDEGISHWEVATFTTLANKEYQRTHSNVMNMTINVKIFLEGNMYVCIGRIPYKKGEAASWGTKDHIILDSTDHACLLNARTMLQL